MPSPASPDPLVSDSQPPLPLQPRSGNQSNETEGYAPSSLLRAMNAPEVLLLQVMCAKWGCTFRSQAWISHCADFAGVNVLQALFQEQSLSPTRSTYGVTKRMAAKVILIADAGRAAPSPYRGGGNRRRQIMHRHPPHREISLKRLCLCASWVLALRCRQAMPANPPLTNSTL